MILSLSRLRANDAAWIDGGVITPLEAIAGELAEEDAAVEVIIVDDEYIQKINREYRGLDRPTDVISFSYLPKDSQPVGSPKDDNLAGEVYVSYETLEKEAKAQGIELKNLFLRVGVHGLLHVIGYDHETESEARRMEEEERRLLQRYLSVSEVDELL